MKSKRAINNFAYATRKKTSTSLLYKRSIIKKFREDHEKKAESARNSITQPGRKFVI